MLQSQDLCTHDFRGTVWTGHSKGFSGQRRRHRRGPKVNSTTLLVGMCFFMFLNYPSKSTLIYTSPDSLEFGAGSHACPGRHFAVNVLKATLSRILTRYDLQLPQGTCRPQDRFNHLFDIIPNPTAGLVFSPRKQG